MITLVDNVFCYFENERFSLSVFVADIKNELSISLTVVVFITHRVVKNIIKKNHSKLTNVGYGTKNLEFSNQKKAIL